MVVWSYESFLRGAGHGTLSHFVPPLIEPNPRSRLPRPVCAEPLTHSEIDSTMANALRVL